MNDNSLLQKLQEHFDVFIDQKDFDKFHSGITSYFRFIENTYPFKNIAQNLFSSSLSPSTVRNLHSLYKWLVFNKENPQKSISPASVEGSGISVFHGMMIEDARRTGLVDKRTIVLHTSKGNKSVCLEGETLHCYSMKGDEPKRFKIVQILFKAETGKSASEVASLCGEEKPNKTVQDNVKKEIEKINTLFKTHCDTSDELIIKTKSKGKNIYFLNREVFIFEKEK